MLDRLFNRSFWSGLSADVRQYLLITCNYWVFTLTDGALRMLVVLHFHQLGYSPLEIALLFLFYEFFGVVTNLVGGWLGARIGLNKTMNIGLGLQIIALAMLLSPSLPVAWVMCAQAISGIAKDLNKMSAKSSIKLLVPNNAQQTLFRWVALLTGSKNTLKGIGFFMGGALLMSIGFSGALTVMIIALVVMWLLSIVFLKNDLGKTRFKPKFSQIFSKNPSINALSAARCFLFGSRDVWFVVALPVYFSTQLHWEHWQTGTFFALWIIAYGLVQIVAPNITGSIAKEKTQRNKVPNGNSALIWASILSLIPFMIAGGLYVNEISGQSTITNSLMLIIGLAIFGIIFAINSSLHSFLIVNLSEKKQVSLDVGFYYMANAMGRLMGTVLSGLLFQWQGLIVCLIASGIMILIATALSCFIDQPQK